MTPRRSRRVPPVLAILLAGTGLLRPAPGAAQDTTAVADTVAAVAAADTLVQAAPDSVPADSLVIHDLPAFPGGRPDGDPGLVARWDRDGLLRARALTLLELLAPLPGMVTLRSGDYGAPEGMVLNGRAGGRLRIFVDGVEETALDGSVPDLAQIPLPGMSSVEVLRSGGETRILLTTAQATRPEPVSTIEAGTGDLDTNIFRGSFVHPNAFGGGLSLLFDRVDTDGAGRQESGTLQSVWLRYLRPLGERFTVSGEIRNRTVESELEQAPPTAKRLTRSVRLRGQLAEGVVAEIFAAQNKLDLTADSAVDDSPRNSHYGGRVGWSLGNVWGEASVRHLNPAGRPSLLRMDVDAGVSREGLGGVSGRLGWDREEGEGRSVWGVSAWTRPLLGIALFGSLDAGARGWGVPAYLGLEAPPDSVSVLFPTGSDATFLRAGARLDLGPLQVEGAFLRTEVDSVLPLGNRVDRGIQAFPGDEASGFEVSGSLALPVEGFTVEGSLQQWDKEGVLRPGRIYRGGLTFHDTFYPTGNLEITGSFLVEGRDPMLLAIPDPVRGGPVRVPFYQSWNAYLQIRVVSVRLFIRWDNLFIRTNNQDLPDRILPRTRAMYGVRWTLVN